MFVAEISIVVLLIMLNGLLAMSELAIVSSRPARLRRMVDMNINGSRRALALASDPGKFLSTVQIGITLVGVLSGALSGSTIGLRLAGGLMSFGLSAGVAEVIGIGVVVAVTTYASLIIGELVPKQIALRNPEAVAVAPAMTILAKAMSHLVWILNASGKAVLWLLGQHGQPDEKVTEEEIRTLISEAEHAGVLEPGEKEMIAGGKLICLSLQTAQKQFVRQLPRAHIPACRYMKPTPIKSSGSSRPRTCYMAICVSGDWILRAPSDPLH